MKGPFLHAGPIAPSPERRPPLWERRLKLPVGWCVERLFAPFARWDPRALLTPEVPVAIRGLSPAFGGYRIALVTDLHHGPCVPYTWIHHVATRAIELAADLVVLGGDFVSHVRADGDGLDRALAEFRARDGVVAVLGNHDHWADPDFVTAMVQAAGVEVLTNAHRMVRRGAAMLAVAGTDDFTHGATRVDLALAGVPADVPRVLVSHNPDLIEYLPAGARVDLMLSGHTHNGQVHFPWVGPLTVPSQFGRKYLHGLKRFRDTQLYVSAGVGTVSIPFRWGNPPELPIIRLEAA